MARFSIHLFGPLELRDGAGRPVAVPGAKQQALLAFLALNTDPAPTRAQLTNLLWGTRFEDQARQSLRQGISRLRKLFGEDGDSLVLADADRVGLDSGGFDIDVRKFEDLAAEGTDESLVQAASLYRGNLLEGFVSGKEEFDSWLHTERSRLTDLACKVFAVLADSHLKGGRTQEAITAAQRLIALDPLRESSHRRLMRIYAQGAERAAALRQYNTLKELLRVELAVEPETATQRLLEEIRGASPPPAPEADHGPSAPSSPFFGAQSASSRPAITVLPFGVLGGMSDETGLAEVMTEDLTTALARYRWLSVVALGARLAPGETEEAFRQRAIDQQAEYAIEGSIRRAGDRVRLTAHLVDLRANKYLWVERYDREAKDSFSISDELSEVIAATVEAELTGIEGERARHIDNKSMSAWDCYHLGLATQYEFGRETNLKAQALFRRAIELDPNFGAAYARLSYALVISTIYFEADQTSGILDEALECARVATRLDDQDAIAQFALGRVYIARGEFASSIDALETAIRLNPSMAQAHCGLGDSLAYAGRLDDSVRHFEEAIRLSPNDPYRWAFLMYGAVAYLFMHDHERALEWGTQATRVPTSHYWANAVQVAALGHLGRKSEAKAALAELLRLKPDFSCSFVRDRLFYLRIDDQREHYLEGLRKAGVPE